MDAKEEKQTEQVKCPFCNNFVDSNMTFCPKCGNRIDFALRKRVQEKTKCSYCNGKINENMEYCPNCGHKIENKKPQQGKTSGRNLALLLWIGAFFFIFIVIIRSISNNNNKEVTTYKESTIHYVSNKIVLDPDTICPNMDPFVYKHGLQLVKVTGKIDIDTKGVEDKTNSLGCVIKLVLSFKNISGSTIERESFKVQYKIKDNETGEIVYSGSEYISLEGVKPDEVWAKSFEVLQCTFFYNNKIKVLLTIDDIEVEELTIKPKM